MGSVSARLPIREFIMFYRREKLHFLEHDSKVRVYFCLLESAMLWRFCALSSCKCGSVQQEDWRAFRSTISRLTISVRLGIMLGMLPWWMWCFAELAIARAAGER